MDRDELLQTLSRMDTKQKVAFIRAQVISGQMDIHDIVNLAPELSRQGVGQPPEQEGNFEPSAENQDSALYATPEESSEGHRGVWMFTSIALSGLAIAAVVAYMIAHHIAH